MTDVHPNSEIFKAKYAHKTFKTHVGMCQLFYTDLQSILSEV